MVIYAGTRIVAFVAQLVPETFGLEVVGSRSFAVDAHRVRGGRIIGVFVVPVEPIFIVGRLARYVTEVIGFGLERV